MFSNLVSMVFGKQELKSFDTSEWEPPVITSAGNSIFPSNILSNAASGHVPEYNHGEFLRRAVIESRDLVKNDDGITSLSDVLMSTFTTLSGRTGVSDKTRSLVGSFVKAAHRESLSKANTLLHLEKLADSFEHKGA